jgi:hypothetical protein
VDRWLVAISPRFGCFVDVELVRGARTRVIW